MSEWRDIDSAPRDGSSILLAGQYLASGKWEIETGQYLAYRRAWPCVGEDQPTHWMPLPPPPNNATVAEGESE